MMVMMRRKEKPTFKHRKPILLFLLMMICTGIRRSVAHTQILMKKYSRAKHDTVENSQIRSSFL